MYTSACFDFCTCSTNTFFITFCVSFFIFFFCFFTVLFSNLLHSHILIQFFTIRAFPIYKINYNYIYSWLLQHNPCTHESATPLLFWPGPLPLFSFFFVTADAKQKCCSKHFMHKLCAILYFLFVSSRYCSTLSVTWLNQFTPLIKTLHFYSISQSC